MLYFESHITIEPVFDEKLVEASKVATDNGFKIANLLMQKRVDDSPERSKYDTFMTGDSTNFDILKERTIGLVKILQKNGFKIWRYKIENVIVDSRSNDEFNLLYTTYD